MHKDGVGTFPYFVGINSLADAATRNDKVCVLNILGTESSAVTPIGHEFSGGNIVFGTGPGKSGKFLETKKGNIPVYNSIKEGRAAGHKFNTAVIYLPPSGVKDGVAEVVRQNPDLEKIIILTEKISIKDARIIRAICQTNGVDVFGGNCLGIADAWNQVRIGGALGGNKPSESLVKGSVAIFSNSGNFTTTIAVYLLTKGWGTTTSISSGKDVYIQYGPQEFFHAFENDARSKAAVLYVEPGGYYEHGITSKKPFIACVVGRWKANLTKACGHAGSLAGSGDDARAKEKWFMDYFGVNSIFSPENPSFSKKGAIVTNIAHIPEALTMVMEANGTKSDFAPQGDLSLKCWMANNQGLKLPEKFELPVVKAVAPYNEQIEIVNRHVGGVFPRQNLKDASGASMMDPKTQVTKVHNVSVLELSKYPLESNLVFALTKDYPSANGLKLANIAFNSFVNMHDSKALIASDAAREAGNSPNTILASAVCILGKNTVADSLKASETLLELFQSTKLEDPFADFDFSVIAKDAQKGSAKDVLLTSGKEPQAQNILKVISDKNVDSVFTRFLKSLANDAGKQIKLDALLAAIWMTLGWSSLNKKKISKFTLTRLSWYSRIFSTLVGCSVDSKKHTKDSFCGIANADLVSDWSFTETAFLALVGRKPSQDELFEFSVLLGLIISNGPGTISAQGPKGAVSSDGPEDPTRVQINKAFAGFLTHTGYAHGGNGFEAIGFLLEIFAGQKVANPGEKNHQIDLKKLAMTYATDYVKYKKKEKEIGNLEYKKIPCVGHPVFKGKDVNVDPREEFVSKLLGGRGSYNVFLDFYQNLVVSLFEAGVSKNVYCVNIDAVIAVILLKIVWEKINNKSMTEKEVEDAAFTTFLFGRMIGSAAEIDDHINRGQNMDTRTPVSKCSYVG